MPAQPRTLKTGPSLAERTSLDAIAARAERAMQSRAQQAQALRLADEQAQVVQAQSVAQAGTPSRQTRRQLERRTEGLHTRELRLLRRDDALVHAVLARKGTLEAVVPLAGATAGDELLWFVLEQLGLRGALAQLQPPAEVGGKDGKDHAHRTMYAPEVLGLLSLMARCADLHGGGEVQASLLCDVRWMVLLGFSVQEVDQGATQRSVSLKGKTRKGHGQFEEPDEAGPVREDARQELGGHSPRARPQPGTGGRSDRRPARDN